jgi:hypothetical protein
MINLLHQKARVSYPRYIPARGQFSLNRRTKTSNFSDVGHTLRSSGISTKIRTTPVTLQAHISPRTRAAVGEYRQMMEKMMRREAWKMLAIPSAMQTTAELAGSTIESNTEDRDDA